jgi:hypothetical protein
MRMMRSPSWAEPNREWNYAPCRARREGLGAGRAADDLEVKYIGLKFLVKGGKEGAFNCQQMVFEDGVPLMTLASDGSDSL